MDDFNLTELDLFSSKKEFANRQFCQILKIILLTRVLKY